MTFPPYFEDEPRTDREARLAQSAFVQGANFRALYCPCPGHEQLACDVLGEAAARFPLPSEAPR